MSTFNPGTGGTLTATNIPAAVYELARLMAQRIRTISEAVRPTDILTAFTDDRVGGISTITFSCPFSVSIQTDGTTRIAATDFFSPLSVSGGSNAFNPGTGGTLKSTGLVQAFVECCQILQNTELLIPEETRPNNVDVTYTTETSTVDITLNLPITLSNLEVRAVDYL